MAGCRPPRAACLSGFLFRVKRGAVGVTGRSGSLRGSIGRKARAAPGWKPGTAPGNFGLRSTCRQDWTEKAAASCCKFTKTGEKPHSGNFASCGSHGFFSSSHLMSLSHLTLNGNVGLSISLLAYDLWQGLYINQRDIEKALGKSTNSRAQQNHPCSGMYRQGNTSLRLWRENRN